MYYWAQTRLLRHYVSVIDSGRIICFINITYWYPLIMCVCVPAIPTYRIILFTIHNVKSLIFGMKFCCRTPCVNIDRWKSKRLFFLVIIKYHVNSNISVYFWHSDPKSKRMVLFFLLLKTARELDIA